MLSKRILHTVRFFGLQEYAVTASEIFSYLIAGLNSIQDNIDEAYELTSGDHHASGAIQFDTLLRELSHLVGSGELDLELGFYTLPEKSRLVQKRLQGDLFAVKRERLIKKYMPFVRHLPFIRGVALGGSQALGLKRSTSDIDLLIVTDASFMWFARTLVSAYFQIFGLRRHGAKITNRFCLNHYIASVKEVDAERNLYKAMEYSRLRFVVYEQTIQKFKAENANWIKIFFPHIRYLQSKKDSQSRVQVISELIFNNRFGLFIERVLGKWQLSRIDQEDHVFVREDELSFHPESKHTQLLQGFFDNQA